MRRGGTVLVLAAAAITLAACSGGTTQSSTSTTKGHPTTTTAATPQTTTTAAPPTTTTVAAVSACQNGNLAISEVSGGAAAGTVATIILFTNNGSPPCTLTGYPGVAALDSQGVQVAQARRALGGMLGGLQNGGTTPPVVTVATGQVASAAIEGTDNPAGTATSCPYYPSFLVTPPDQTQSTTVSLGGTAAFPGCSQIEVNPVVPGNTGKLS